MCAQLSLGERRSRGTEAAAQVPPQAHRSVTNFAVRYADQNERDYAEFVAAIRSGQLTAVEGV